MNPIRLLLLILLLGHTAAGGADPFAPSDDLRRSPGMQRVVQQGDGALRAGGFLPVEQAYRLTPAWFNGQLVLHWEIAPGYYLYRDRFAATADGDALPLTLPPGVPHEDAYFGRVEVFYGSVEATIAPAALDPRGQQPFTLAVTSQGCADAGLCYPPQTEQWRIDPATGQAQRLAEPSSPGGSASAPAGDRGWLWMALAALAGGALLNLMPCVFPVLSLKALSFQRSEGAVQHGLSYTAGVILSFVALAAVLLALRATGLALGWGFQLQQPIFVGALAYLFVALGLALSGVWTLGAGWMGIGQRLSQHQGLPGSFFTGVLAVLVASPCTAPLMGAAMGYALLQPPGPALGLFAALGLGMALPLLALSASPRLLQRLPRPGAWMERFKQALAFPLYASAIWLLWVIGRQAGPTAMALALLGCLLVALALWLLRPRLGNRLAAAFLLGLALTLLAGGELAPRSSGELRQPSDNAVPYSAAALAELRAAGTPVLLNATADWCLTCLANERAALATEAVQAELNARGFIYMVADWTHYDAAISDLLAGFGRGGVPLYVVFKPGAAPQVLPQILTPGTIIDAIR